MERPPPEEAATPRGDEIAPRQADPAATPPSPASQPPIDAPQQTNDVRSALTGTVAVALEEPPLFDLSPQQTEQRQRLPESAANAVSIGKAEAEAASKTDTAPNGSFDLFCFNEGNSDEMDTSKEDNLPLGGNTLHEADHGAALDKPGESIVYSGYMNTPSGSLGVGQADANQIYSEARSDAAKSALNLHPNGHRDIGDIGIYAEEEIGDEWEEELEAASAGTGMLDDSREDDEQAASAELPSLSIGAVRELSGQYAASAHIYELGTPAASSGTSTFREDSSRRDREKEGDRDQMWKAKFDQLKEFHEQNGHCEVKGRKNKALSAWIRRQRYLWRNGKLSEDRRILLEGLGFVWTQRGNISKKGGKRVGSDHSDNESDVDEHASMAAMRDLAAYSSEEASLPTRGREGVDSSRGKLGLDRYIKKRRGSVSHASNFGDDDEEGDEALLSDGGHSTPGKRNKRSKNYMTKGRTDAWMRKYDEFRNKNLRGDLSWKDNVQLRAWVRQQRYLWRNGKLSRERYVMLNKAGFEWEPDKGKKERRSRSGFKGRGRPSGDGNELMGSEDEEWDDDDEWGDEHDDSLGPGFDDLEKMEEEEEMVALIIRHADEIGRKNEEKHKEWEREEEERRRRDDERRQIEAEWTAIQSEWQDIERERRKLESGIVALDIQRRKVKERKCTLKEQEARTKELLNKSKLLHKRIDAEQAELDEQRRQLVEDRREEQRRASRERQLWCTHRTQLEDEVRELRARLSLALGAVTTSQEASTTGISADIKPFDEVKPEFDSKNDSATPSDAKGSSGGQVRNRKRKRNDDSSPPEPNDKEQESLLRCQEGPHVPSTPTGSVATSRAATASDSARPNRAKRAASQGVAELIKRQKRDVGSSTSSTGSKEKQPNDLSERHLKSQSPSDDQANPVGRATSSEVNGEPLKSSFSTSITVSRKKKKKKRRSGDTATKVGGVHHDAIADLSERMVGLNHC